MTPWLIICNPAAGRGRLLGQWPVVQQTLREAGVAFDVAMTRAPGDAISLACQAPGRYRGVVAVGGDGTVHEVGNGLLLASDEQSTLPMAVIPLGSGDDFAKMIPPQAPVGGKCFDWREAVAKIARGQTQPFDCARLAGWKQADGAVASQNGGLQYLINGMDLGFGAHANRNMASMPFFMKGFAAYLGAILKTLANIPQLRLRVQLDGDAPIAISTTMTAICNGRSFGGSFWVTPQAQADDGLLDVLLVQALGRVAILGLIPKITKGRHLGDPRLRIVQARRVLIESEQPFAVEVDGEMPFSPLRRLQVDVLPGRLTVVV